MPHDVYIFGYQSMLAEGSLASTVGTRTGVEDYVPARLTGYVRDWQAVRDFSANPRKRYVHTADWRPAGRVAFANLNPDPDHAVNGLCHRVATDRLGELDFREQGYARVEVGDRLMPYPGHRLDPGLPCYTYIDLAPDPRPASVSRAYYDMGRNGALAIDRQVPGFAADYLASSHAPGHLADDLAFVFIGADGRHLWLLDETDSSLVLLLRFARPQLTATSDSLPELTRPVSRGLDWLDRRGPRQRPGSHPRIPAALADELAGAATPTRLAGSAHWLSRLTAVEAAGLTGAQLETLAADPDPWVQRAARLHLGDPT